MGAAGLSMIIPPSGVGIILAMVANISIAALFIAGYIPGLVMAGLYAVYIIIRCLLRPDLAPKYDVNKTPLSRKIIITIQGAVPVIFIIFSVMGLMFLGIATPSESAAMGALAAFVLAFAYKRFSWGLALKCLEEAAHVAAIMLIILLGASSFGQIVSFTGALNGMTELVLNLTVSPLVIHIVMIVIILLIGTIMDDMSMIMITIPVYMPLVTALEIDPVYFGMTILMALVVAGISPPFGMVMFVMKGVSPPEITLGDVFRATIPYCLLDIVAIVIILVFPGLVLWLPGLMGVL
jgi:tripartite ATP-independent transporter DctM subunit